MYVVFDNSLLMVLVKQEVIAYSYTETVLPIHICTNRMSYICVYIKYLYDVMFSDMKALS